MSATDELRRLLDERGAVYERAEDDTTIYYDSDGNRYTYNVNPDSGWAQLFGYNLTPEQAIAATLGANDGNKPKSDVRAADVDANDANATLGGGKLTAEQVREAIKGNAWAETSTLFEFGDSSWQAIADELNAAMGGGECEITDNGPWGYPYVCSVCDASFDADVNNGDFNFCPNCGRKVER